MLNITAIQLICKTSIDAGKGCLLELLHAENDEDFLQAVKVLNWYGKSADITDCIEVIVRSFDKVHDEETLRHIGYVLEASNAITFPGFARFLCHSDSKMQTAAIYATGNCHDKADNWEIIEQMLKRGGKQTIKNTISYWGIIPYEKLLPYYKAKWPEYKSNPNFREQFTACLKELGLPDDYFDRA